MVMAKKKKSVQKKSMLATISKIVRERPADVAMLVLLLLFLGFVILKYHEVI